MPDAATERIAALLAGLVNYERTRPNAIEWTLETTRALLARPGASHATGRAIQVGGSKGKGTTCAYLESLARSAGLAVGTYLSPHVQSVLERVRVRGREISEPALAATLAQVVAHVHAARLPATFFEVMTVAAAQIFAEQALDLAIWEVGIGGRLDATTAIDVDASILTTVELEHTQLLGDTVEKIAAEKAFVVRPGRPAFTAIEGPALDVVRAHAQRVGARLYELGRDFAIEGLDAGAERCTGELRAVDGSRHRFELLGATEAERSALVLAFACLSTVAPGITPQLLPVPRPSLPGRFEVVQDGDGVWVLDGAHTETSLRLLAREVARRFPSRNATLLFAAAIDKRWREGLRSLLPLVDSVHATRLADTVSVEPDEIVAWCRLQGARAQRADDVESGVAALARMPGVRLVTGSFYLVGAARSLLARPQRHEHGT